MFFFINLYINKYNYTHQDNNIETLTRNSAKEYVDNRQQYSRKLNNLL